LYEILAFDPTQTDAGITKFAVGTAFTVTICVVAGDKHPLWFTVRETVFEPALAYVIVCGPTAKDVAGIAPTPKFQIYVDPAAAVPVNVTVVELPAQIAVGLNVNVDVGAVLTEIVFVVVDEHEPDVTVSVTVLLPMLDQLTL